MRQFLQNIQKRLAQSVEIDFASEHPYRNVPFILVTGQGRSGTTVVRNAIAEHPGVHSKNTESNTLFEFLGVVHKHGEHQNRVQNLAVNRESYLELMANTLLTMHWPETRPANDLPGFISTYSISNSSTCVAFKEVFPNSRFCYVLRNGIEVVSSRMKFDSLPFKDLSFEEHCGTWATSVREMLQWGANRDDFFVIRHEWLLDRQATTDAFQRLLETENVSEIGAVVDKVFSETYHPTAFDDEPAENQSDLQTRCRRWELWTEEQKSHFRNECGDAMILAGYDVPM